MVDPIKTRIKGNLQNGLFHDSRADINTLVKVMQELIIKTNELINVVNKLSIKEDTNHDN
jgi:hypothetical protein